MQDQLDQISAAERAVFKFEIAGAIYLKLKSQPRRYKELESTISCWSNSLDNNLKKGIEIGVWEKSGKHYCLTNKGKNLPDIIAVHAKLQQEHEIVYKGTKCTHANVEGGTSQVIAVERKENVAFTWSADYSEVIQSHTTKVDSVKGLFEWFNPKLFD